MTPTISFEDWVDWLAIERTFRELCESAPPPLKSSMTATVRRMAEGIGEAELDKWVSQIPDFEKALNSFSAEEQTRFGVQFAMAITEFAQHLAGALEQG